MAARGYEISLRVFFHTIHYVTIATVFISRVKISCFRAEAHLVFHWCLYNKISFETIPSPFWQIIIKVAMETSWEHGTFIQKLVWNGGGVRYLVNVFVYRLY